MHMVCRAGGCSYEFCWLCRGPWSEHSSETGGYYACNKYNASSAKKEDETAANIKTELDAYMFYFHRYESHHNAMKIANAQRRNAETKSSDLMDRFGVRPQDTKFLMEATEQLLDNRRCLKYSYVYGYYLKSPAEKSLFEYLQEDLEKHTNTLSELYERNLDDFKGNFGEFSKWKETVTNYVRVTSGFLDKFVRGVAQGLDVLH
jgi:ariadne-1